MFLTHTHTPPGNEDFIVSVGKCSPVSICQEVLNALFIDELQCLYGCWWLTWLGFHSLLALTRVVSNYL